MPPKTQTAPVKAFGPKKGVSSPHKRVKSAKPPRSVEEQLERHFTSLCAQIDGGFFKNAIKTCDRILRIVPTDEDTLRTKLFLLLQTDQYKSALELIDTPTLGKSSSSVNQFEKAYILYRLHREQEAREILDAMSVEGSERRVQHLDAQVKFRQGDYHGARELYNELLATCPAETDEYPDILVNLDASQTHIDFLEKDYLTGVHALPTNQSASALEALPAPSIVAALSTITNSTPGAGPGPSTAAARASGSEPHAAAAKRSRKSRVPKHVVPGVTPPPDPERWLKKRERTARYDGGRRWRNAKHTGLGTQGSAIADSTPGSGPGASSKAASGSGANPTGHGKKGKKGK